MKLHQIVPYLPYGLNIKILNHKCDYVGIEYAKANGFYFIAGSLHITYEGGSTGKDISVFKPILRPISDILILINHNGKKICLVEWLEEFYCTLDLHQQAIRLTNDIRWVNQCDYMLIMHLIEYHFDVFGLIDAGLAIDINTVPELLNG